MKHAGLDASENSYPTLQWCTVIPGCDHLRMNAAKAIIQVARVGHRVESDSQFRVTSLTIDICYTRSAILNEGQCSRKSTRSKRHIVFVNRLADIPNTEEPRLKASANSVICSIGHVFKSPDFFLFFSKTFRQ